MRRRADRQRWPVEDRPDERDGIKERSHRGPCLLDHTLSAHTWRWSREDELVGLVRPWTTALAEQACACGCVESPELVKPGCGAAALLARAEGLIVPAAVAARFAVFIASTTVRRPTP